MKNTNTKQTATKLLKKQVESKLTDLKELKAFYELVNQSDELEREEEYRYMQSREGGIYE